MLPYYKLQWAFSTHLVSARQGSPRGQFFLVASKLEHGLHW